jgi:hypothetical protein
MGMAFEFRLEHDDGTPADPPTLKAAVPTGEVATRIALGRDRMLRVVETRPGTEPDEDPVRVVESV